MIQSRKIWMMHFLLTIVGLIAVVAGIVMFNMTASAQNERHDGLTSQIEQLQTKLADLELAQQKSIQERCFEVRLSAYTMSVDETSSDPTVTATMTKTVPGRTAAVSRDLMPQLLGKRIYIPGLGVWKCDDVMNARHTQAVDLCVNTKTEAFQFGIRNHIVIVLE